MRNLDEPIDLLKIDKIIMFKMIHCLLKYTDAFDARCLVNAFLEKRTDKEELDILKEIQRLLYEYKREEVKKLLEDKIYPKKEKFNFCKMLKKIKKS